MFSVAFYTLGCKLNQLESESIAESFRNAGFKALPWESGEEHPSLLIVNTCTVTSKAEQKARRIIRGALKDHLQGVILVTGCYAQMDPLSIELLEKETTGCSENRLFVIPGDQKSTLLDLPRFLIQESRRIFDESGDLFSTAMPALVADLVFQWVQTVPNKGFSQKQERFRFNPGNFFFHSRPFLKIQDGCDNACSYCRVSIARGPSVSFESPHILGALKTLEDRGYGEAVLTGVNISQYRDGSRDLAGLLDYLLRETDHIRLRLSSLEPEGINRDLLAVLSNPRIRPHIHLSVQSGSVSILERMGRRYTPDVIDQAVQRIRSVKHDPFVACDIIAGFPGETEEDFEATYCLCWSLDFAWIHAFPYSRRPDTAAYTFKEAVPERESRLRVDRLLVLGNEGRRNYIRRWLGRTLEGIAETDADLPASLGAVVSENYLKLLLTGSVGDSPKPGSILRCRLLDFPDPPGTLFSGFDALAVPL
ncbi:MAG: tRNA (N(6)-L-threonylcarbamoyladenosine(37)-C(2))-methylthiotransferase MtaB [Treponema sp.]|jgi:threonylcarbamoyladenosine tRNA methylthiotransferase MtaB|nr:tRNA (N(6)-L-threonylcarbamoyladenosine(37)-C(2))-methylthiotransferase MtaB [Treponema sp.]